jgi:DNA polymerase/3'-5' exonuclease PolX
MPNATLAAKLRRFAQIYDFLGETYRSAAYATAADNVESMSYEIDAGHLPDLGERKIQGVGKTILKVIEEFARTGRVSELEKLEASPEIRAYEAFSKIMGVGTATAAKWIQSGVLTLEELRRRVDRGEIELTQIQSIGLKYYADLNTRIPRAEVTEIAQHIYEVAKRVSDEIGLQGLIFDVAGSYRRGAQTSGDIDILITHCAGGTHTSNVHTGGAGARASARSLGESQQYRDAVAVFLEKMHDSLRQDRGYVAPIILGRQRVSLLFRLDDRGLCRQCDLLYIPYESYYAALNYFTGSGKFNEYVRGVAKEKGYRLNQMGLYRDGKLIPTNSERDIFDILEIPWVPPAERNWG